MNPGGRPERTDGRVFGDAGCLESTTCLLVAQVLQGQGIHVVAVQERNTARLAVATQCGVRGCGLGIGANLEPPAAVLETDPDAVIEATGVPAVLLHQASPDERPQNRGVTNTKQNRPR